MVRRGSPVRVRKRALRKPRKRGFYRGVGREATVKNPPMWGVVVSPHRSKLASVHGNAPATSSAPRGRTEESDLPCRQHPRKTQAPARSGTRPATAASPTASGQGVEDLLRHLGEQLPERRLDRGRGGRPPVQAEGSQGRGERVVLASKRTVREVGEAWFKAEHSRWRDSYADELRRNLNTQIYPEFGGDTVGRSGRRRSSSSTASCNTAG